MDTTDESTTAAAPLSRWQALRERWAMVRAKVAAFFSARPNLIDAPKSLALGVILVALIVWALIAMFDGRSEPVANVAPESAAAVVVAPINPELISLTQCGQVLWAYNDAQTKTPAKAATVLRSAQPRAQATAPAAEPFDAITEQPERRPWGTTDLDRAIESFNQSLKEHQP